MLLSTLQSIYVCVWWGERILHGVSDSAGTLYDDNGEFETVISYG